MAKFWKDYFYECYKNNKYEDCLKTLQKNCPQTFVKFCSGKFNDDGSNDFLNTLKNDEVWMSSPLKFNDPFDCALNLGDDNVELQVLSFLADSLNIPGFYGKMCKTFESDTELKQKSDNNNVRIRKDFEKVRKEIFVSCFSDGKMLQKSLMWSHYANCHTGYCVEYDGKDLLKCANMVLMPVHYKDEIRPLWNYFIDTMSKQEFQLVSAYTKSEEWKYEKEWRILEVKPNISGYNGYRLKIIQAKNVYVGCKASIGLINALKILCKEKSINLYRMKMEPNSFKLSYDQIDTN